MSKDYLPKKSKLIATIENTEFTEARLSLQKMQDNSLRLDLRQYYCTKRDPEKKPTAKGTSIPATVEHIDELISALKKARKFVVKKG